ncbi:MAG: hypothetical protein J7K73_04065 [Nanoarchaeota archaeon]|nr:hypothetical protein [Nanoarchaeota archaeon]
MAKKRKKTTKKKPKRRVTRKKTPSRRATKRTKRVKSAVAEAYFDREFRKLKRLKHKPWIGAVLNFFVWGTGFMYIGRFIYGLMWLLAAALLLVPTLRMQRFLPNEIYLYMMAGYFVISVLLAVEAYFDAKEILHWRD